MKKVYISMFILALGLGAVSCQGESSVSEDTTAQEEVDGEVKETSDNGTSTDTREDALTVIDTEGETATNPTSSETTTEGEEVLEANPTLAAEELPEATVEIVVEDAKETYDFHAYDKLNSFLSKYVTYSGKVNYSSIKAHKSELTDITKEFEDNFPGSGWSSTQKMTYWINAYNVYTIKLIVDNYPTSSITKITAKPWHKKFIKLNGATYSLNQIENDIIRKRFNEPRVHFALNCASKSCPVLLNKAYTPKKLYGQLTSQTKRFLKDTSKNQFGEKSIKISSIFDWYKEDFTKGGSTVIDFFNKYRTEQLSDPKVSYMVYSWDLNK